MRVYASSNDDDIGLNEKADMKVSNDPISYRFLAGSSLDDAKAPLRNGLGMMSLEL
jgi:hypothetical protein